MRGFHTPPPDSAAFWGLVLSALLRRGKSLDAARKIALGCCAAAMPVVMLVSLVPVSMALVLFSIAFFAQQAWSGLVMTLPADIFPLSLVGTVAGLIGFGGAIGGAIFGVIAGFLLGHGVSYGALFVSIGTFHLVRLCRHHAPGRQNSTDSRHRHKSHWERCMKITEVRTRVVQWEGETVPLPPNFCTNPMDLVSFRKASMGNFAFHNWLLVEIFTDTGLVGLGNAALAPLVSKQLLDTYLKPILIGADPWDVEYLWQQMYRRTLAFGRKGVALAAISAADIAIWDILGKDAKQPVFRLLGGRTKDKIPVYASRLYAMPLDELREEAQKYKDQGYTMMKLRFGYGPMDGRRGHAEKY